MALAKSVNFLKSLDYLSMTEEHTHIVLHKLNAKPFSSLLFLLGMFLRDSYCRHSQAGMFGYEKAKNA